MFGVYVGGRRKYHIYRGHTVSFLPRASVTCTFSTDCFIIIRTCQLTRMWTKTVICKINYKLSCLLLTSIESILTIQRLRLGWTNQETCIIIVLVYERAAVTLMLLANIVETLGRCVVFARDPAYSGVETHALSPAIGDCGYVSANRSS